MHSLPPHPEAEVLEALICFRIPSLKEWGRVVARALGLGPTESCRASVRCQPCIRQQSNVRKHQTLNPKRLVLKEKKPTE